MEILKYLIAFLLLINSAFGQGFSDAQFKKRLQVLQKLNMSLAKRVYNLKRNCFSNKKFSVNKSNKSQIPKVFTAGFLSKLHAFDMEHGISSRRNLDGRSDKDKGSPGRVAIDLVLDLLRNEISNGISTHQLIMKTVCSASNLLTKYDLTSHVATSVEKKLLRGTGNCWDYSHIAIRLAKELNIKLTRENKGVHIFVKYRIPDIKNKKVYFYVDALNCRSIYFCLNEISDPKYLTDPSAGGKFFTRTMKEEVCYLDAMKRDPSYYIFSDIKKMK